MTTANQSIIMSDAIPESPAQSSPDKKSPDKKSMFDPAIVRGALRDCFIKLDPRTMVRNPVMFIVEVGSVICTLLFFRDLGSSTGKENLFSGLV